VGTDLRTALVYVFNQMNLRPGRCTVKDMSLNTYMSSLTTKASCFPKGMSHNALCPSSYSPANITEKVVVDSGQKSNLFLETFPTLRGHMSERLKDTLKIPHPLLHAHTYTMYRVQTHVVAFC